MTRRGSRASATTSPPGCATRQIRSVAAPVAARASNLKGQSALTRQSNGLFAPPRDWDALRRAYETCTGELVDVATANNITEKTLRRYALDKKWVCASNVAPARLNKPPKRTVPIGEDKVAKGATKQRPALLQRLYVTIDRKLQQLEASMAVNEDLSPADHERETRIIGSLIRGVEKVNELNRSETGHDKSKSGLAGADTGLDADELCLELAARIRRLRERRPD